MVMNKSHYFLSPVLVYDGPNLKLGLHRALVSRSGVYKVFEESEELRDAFLEGRVFRVKIDGFEAPARLVRESGPSGTHYNLALLDDSAELHTMLGKVGFESPWRRHFARIPASAMRTEIPAGALIIRSEGAVMGQVKNFSYHGLCVEMHSTEEAVGQLIKFKLTTSKGLVLEEASGRVARIHDEVLVPGKIQRLLGLRIAEMSESTQKIYLGMILDAFRILHTS